MGAPKVVDKLSSYGLTEIAYWIYTSHEKFDVEKFRAEVGSKDERFYECTVMPRDPATDYSIQISCHTGEKKEVAIQLEYSSIEGPAKGKSKQGPVAEEFGEWLGQFFKYDTTQGHIHGHFSYPLASRQSKFPLPLKTSIEDAEIDGVSLRLPAKPEGVQRVRLTQGKERWYVEVIADRKITFKGFTPYPDVRALTLVVNTLMEERKS